jgi:hypothetical protein
MNGTIVYQIVSISTLPPKHQRKRFVEFNIFDLTTGKTFQKTRILYNFCYTIIISQD